MEKYERLKNAVNEFDKLNLLVIGDLMLDKYIIGDVDRISQEAPVPIVNVKQIEYILGGAANVAACTKLLGPKCTIIGQVGNDPNGYTLKSLLYDIDINPVLKVNNELITTTKNRLMSRTNQQMLRYDEETTNKINENFVISYIYTKLKSYDGLIISDYGKGCITNDILSYINRKCEELNIPIFLDPSPKTKYSEKMYNTYLLPNNFESEQLNLSLFPTKIITKGKDGIEIIRNNSVRDLIKPLEVQKVWNTTGAGDIISSIFSLGILNNLTLEESATLSNIGAGISIKQPLTYPVSKEELLKELDKNKENL